MRRDDIEHVLDTMASEVAPPQVRADTVVERGRRRARRRRVTIVGVAALAVGAAVMVGTVVGSHSKEQPASKGPISTAASEPEPSSEVAAPTPSEAWKCRNPIEYTNDGGRTWRATELAGVPDGGLSCTAVAGGIAWAVAQSRATHNWQVIRVRNGGTDVDTYDFPVKPDGIVTDPTFVDTEHGWISVIRRGRASSRDLYRTSDGGMTWTPARGRGAGAVSFENADLGWSTNGTAVLRTSNGGASWRPVHPTSGTVFEVVAIPGGAVAWAGVRVGPAQYKPFLEVTTDEGRTWTQRPGPADFERTNAFNFFDVSDAEHWALMSGNALRVTEDAGRTWQSRPDVPGLSDPSDPASMAFPSAQVVWVTDRTGTILRTDDGGYTWDNVTAGGEHAISPQRQPVPIPLAFASPTEGWLCSGPTMRYTTDAGAKWKNVDVPSHPPTPPRSQLPVCAAITGGDAWMLTASADGDGLQVIDVSDGGRHVGASAFPQLRSDWTVRDLAFADREHGWAFATDAAGGASTMFATSDGGRTWHDDAPERGATVFATPKEGWAALELLPSELAHTVDGGRTWERVPFSYEGRLRPIAATGDTVVVLASSMDNSDVRFLVGGVGGSEAGRRLPRDLAATPIDQIAAGAIDADHWQVGSGSTLWTTDTGGRTWRLVADFAGFSAISAVHFLTPDVGFVSATGRGAAANAAVVLRTLDGGTTWTLADGWQLFGRYH